MVSLFLGSDSSIAVSSDGGKVVNARLDSPVGVRVPGVEGS